MRANYVQYGSPQFRILSDKQIEEIHCATLQILERTGVKFDSPEAIELLDGAGADVSDKNRVKIPPYLVEQALRAAPKSITVYKRNGELAMVLNGTGPHFVSVLASQEHLDPYTGKRRRTYVEDISDVARVVDALPNLEAQWTSSAHNTVPGSIADKVALLYAILNTTKPVAYCLNDAESLKEMIEVCSIIAGSEDQLRKKPFLIGSSEPVTPLMQGVEPVEKSLLCAEKGIPNIVYGFQMAGGTTPATWPAELAIANAEVLSQLVVIQLKHPGAPVIYGGMPSIMDMKTTIASYGAPELAFNIAALTEICHYYKLPMLGTAGTTDSDIIGIQTTAEVLYQLMLAALSGADFVHDVGLMYHCTTISPELMVLCDELINMVKVCMGGININSETMPLDLIERVGPGGAYVREKHTLRHFREFWAPTLFDRSLVKKEETKDCETLLREKTIDLIEHYQPEPLPEDVLKEVRKIEARWLKQVGLKKYPRRPT